MLDLILSQIPDGSLSWLGWVERLGGWAVVVYVIRYFMHCRTAENKEHKQEMVSLVGTWKQAVDSFQEFESENRTTHEVIVDSLKSQAETLTLIEANTRRSGRRGASGA